MRHPLLNLQFELHVLSKTSSAREIHLASTSTWRSFRPEPIVCLIACGCTRMPLRLDQLAPPTTCLKYNLLCCVTTVDLARSGLCWRRIAGAPATCDAPLFLGALHAVYSHRMSEPIPGRITFVLHRVGLSFKAKVTVMRTPIVSNQVPNAGRSGPTGTRPSSIAIDWRRACACAPCAVRRARPSGDPRSRMQQVLVCHLANALAEWNGFFNGKFQDRCPTMQ